MKRGTLALHLALTTDSSVLLKAIQVLVEAWPDAVHVQDDDGHLPLHHAGKNFRCTDYVIQLLVRSWPESCQVSTKDNQLPLHLACSYNSSTVTLFVLDSYPQAVRFKDNSLQLPLHIACMRPTTFSSKVIERLVRAWQESVQIPCPYNART